MMKSEAAVREGGALRVRWASSIFDSRNQSAAKWSSRRSRFPIIQQVSIMPDTTSSIPSEITESIAISSLKSIAEQPSVLSNVLLSNLIMNTNMAQQNAVSFQQTQNSIQATVTGKVVGMLTTLGPLEAMSSQQILTGNTTAEEIADLKAALGSPTAADAHAAAGSTN